MKTIYRKKLEAILFLTATLLTISALGMSLNSCKEKLFNSTDNTDSIESTSNTLIRDNYFPENKELWEDVKEWSKRNLEYYPELKDYNNPYMMCEEGELVKFDNIDNAHYHALRILLSNKYEPMNYSCKEEFFYTIYDAYDFTTNH